MAIKTFSVGEVLTSSDTNTYLANSGLVYIASNTFSGSGGVEFQNCFTSTYDNYRFVMTWYGSIATNINTQYMTGTNTRDTALTYNRNGFYWTSSINSFNGANNVNDFVGNHSTTASDFSTATIEFYRPNVSGVRSDSTVTSFSGDSGLTCHISNSKATTTSYTGLYVYPSSGTMTGTITCYGYRKP